jgi:hypothetical protein
MRNVAYMVVVERENREGEVEEGWRLSALGGGGRYRRRHATTMEVQIRLDCSQMGEMAGGGG